MKLAATTASTAAFTLDPTLPWLFSDPKMQEPSAFHGMRTVTLNEKPWEPMALYFPASAELAMRRLTSLDQLTVGAAYWSEMDYFEPSKNKVVTSYSFGRYVGPAYPESSSTARRWKKREAHVSLEADVLDCDLASYHFCEDGTITRFVDMKGSTHRLYQITHYVNLPAQHLASLGVEAVKKAGLTLKQAVWLKQEHLIRQGANELTTCMSGGLNLPDYRVVMPDDESAKAFYNVWASLPTLTPGQARKCKSGTLAITSRTYNHAGQPYGYTEHYKLEDVAPMLGWFRTHSELQRLKIEAAIAAQQLEYHASALRAEREAKNAQVRADQAKALAETVEPAQLAILHTYPGIEELAYAA